MKVGITLIAILFTGTMLFAQSEKKEVSKTLKTPTSAVKKVDDNKYKVKADQNKFSGVAGTKEVNKVETQSILQELYLIMDVRTRAERNESLSSSERSSIIAKNANEYNLKKIEFKNYVSTEGVLNVSSKEQGYYISLLKNDNEVEECKRVIALIKSSK